MQPITPEQLKCIATICSVNKVAKDAKEAMVSGFSGGRCTSSKELSQQEAADLIKHLQQLYPPPPDNREKMRRNIIAMAHEMGWRKNGKADIERINAWCQKFGKKNLNDYSYGELPKLVYAFKQVYQHFLKNVI